MRGDSTAWPAAPARPPACRAAASGRRRPSTATAVATSTLGAPGARLDHGAGARPRRARRPDTSAVSGQVNASVAVPGQRQALDELVARGDQGRDRQAGQQRERAPSSAASRPARAARPRAAAARRSAGVRRAATPRRRARPRPGPPTPLAADHTASSTPASSFVPSASLNAGSATSIEPSVKPTGRLASTSVRSPGDASAPSPSTRAPLALALGARAPGAARRAAAACPRHAQPADTISAYCGPDRGHHRGGEQRADHEDRSRSAPSRARTRPASSSGRPASR